MTESEAFLAQARYDFASFSLLDGAFLRGCAPESQALHFLQMATEKLGKAAYLARKKEMKGRRYHDDRYFQVVWNAMQTSPLEAELGLTKQGLTEMLTRCDSVRARISELQPQVAGSAHRNVEYPWENSPDDWSAPGDTSFGLLAVGGATSSDVFEFAVLVAALLKHFASIFPPA